MIRVHPRKSAAGLLARRTPRAGNSNNQFSLRRILRTCLEFCLCGGALSTDEELRALCLQALQAQTAEGLETSFRALRVALNEHFLDAENLGIHLLLKMGKEVPVIVDKGDTEPKDGTEG